MPVNKLPPKPPPLPRTIRTGQQEVVRGHEQLLTEQRTVGKAEQTDVDRLLHGSVNSLEDSTPFSSTPSLKGSVLGTRLDGGHIEPRFGTPAFEMKLDQLTGSKRRSNNRLKTLFDGVNSFAERHKLIEGATKSINLQTFIFTDDETGWELARALAKKADEGLEVRVIYDALGSVSTDKKVFDFMRDHGVEVRPYAELTDVLNINARWHQKSMIVDGQAAVMGGMNIADEYAFGGSGRLMLNQDRKSPEPWRDVDVLVEGPAVTDAQQVFLDNWARLGTPVSDAQRAELLPEATTFDGGPEVRVVKHDPFPAVGEGDQHTRDLYVQCIRSATRSITIENAYFIPSADIREALKDAAQRGVKVRILTNSEETNDIGVVSECARYFYRELLEAGCEIFEKTGGTLHAKTASFDGEYAIIGSHNLNGRSEGRDAENVIGTSDHATAEGLDQRFAEGVKEANQVTLDELQNQGVFRSLKQFALSSLAWTF
jgi:cardiolipin synthase